MHVGWVKYVERSKLIVQEYIYASILAGNSVMNMVRRHTREDVPEWSSLKMLLKNKYIRTRL